MPKIYQHKMIVTVFVWDSELRSFVDLEEMLSTKGLRDRAKLCIQRHDCPYPSKSDYSAKRDYTWREFVAMADFDGVILERLKGRGSNFAEEIRQQPCGTYYI